MGRSSVVASRHCTCTLITHHTKQLELRIKMGGLILDESEFGTYPGESSDLVLEPTDVLRVLYHTNHNHTRVYN